MRIGSVRRNSQVFERLYSFETIESFGHEDDVRMQVRNQLQAWIDSAAHSGLFLRISRVVAEFGIADEMILQPKRVDGFRQTRRERHDTVDRLGDTNRAAGFVGNFPIGWGCRKDRRSALSMRQRRAEKQGCDGGQEGASEAPSWPPSQPCFSARRCRMLRALLRSFRHPQPIGKLPTKPAARFVSPSRSTVSCRSRRV